jgi:hypothetical protein
MTERTVRKAADRLAKWVDKIISEDCGKGVRSSTLMGADAALHDYRRVTLGSDYVKHLKDIVS